MNKQRTVKLAWLIVTVIIFSCILNLFQIHKDQQENNDSVCSDIFL